MALDAFVYCDCFERDNLRCEPPHGLRLKVTTTGEITCDAPDERAWSAFSSWRISKACLHEGMILVRHRLGTTQLIDQLREELERDATHFPMLIKRVLYSGTHTCDWIPLHCMGLLTAEIRRLDPESNRNNATDQLRHFKIQMAELVIAAQLAKKPICF